MAGFSSDELSAEVREICQRYGLPYNTGSLGRQLGSVAKKICRLALPGRRDRSRTGDPVVAEPVAA